MRYRIASALVVMFLLALPGHADPAQWGCCVNPASNYPITQAAFGTRSTTSDDYDPPSSPDPYAPADRALYTGGNLCMYVAIYHNSEDEGSTWTGPSGFYEMDYRSPIALIPGQSKTWTMYVWAAPGATATSIPLEYLFNGSPQDELHFTLTLKYKPEGIIGGPSVGTVWDLSAQPEVYVSLPVFRTANGLEGYVFDFTATVVPEPASLAALCAGLIPLAFRRRRR